MEHSRFFCYMAKQIESHKGITNIRTVEKVMPQQISSNGFAGGGDPGLCRLFNCSDVKTTVNRISDDNA